MAPGPPDPGPAWSLPEWAAAILAVSPAGAGGLLVSGPSGPETEAWRTLAGQLIPIWTTVGPTLDPEHLTGALDLARTLESGRLHHVDGLIARVGEGVLEVRWPALLGTAAAHALASIAGSVGLVAFQPISSGAAGDDEVEPLLAERMAIWLTIPPRWTPKADPAVLAARVRDAKAGLVHVSSPPRVTRQLIAGADAWGVGDPRTLGAALRVARYVCALQGRTAVSEADVAPALAMVVAPRGGAVDVPRDDTRTEPEVDDAAAPPDQVEPPPSREPAGESAGPDELDTPEPSDVERIVQATRTWMPPGVLARTGAGGAAARSGKGGSRAASARSTGVTGRGRTLRSRPGMPGRGRRLHVLETLRAAAPMQTLRGRSREDGLAIRREDLRIRVTERRDPTTVVFTVDASGSQAVARLGEVKGAVELLLAESYRRRDHVALVAFRGAGADLALPPTRSLTRARAATTGLAGGGGTPLAHGLALAGRVAAGEARVGRRPMIVLLTDGRPNVPMGEGRTGRQHAKEDAIRVGRTIADQRWPVLVVDSARRPQSYTDELAAALGARVIRLTSRDPRALSEAIAAGIAPGQGVPDRHIR